MRILITFLVVSTIFFSSCEELLEVPNISNEQVELLAPSDSTIVLQSDVNFTWNEVYEASQYHVQIATPDFDNTAQIVLDTLVVVDSLYTSPRLNKNLADGDYEWRVKAQNSDYETNFTLSQFMVETSGN